LVGRGVGLTVGAFIIPPVIGALVGVPGEPPPPPPPNEDGLLLGTSDGNGLCRVGAGFGAEPEVSSSIRI